MTKLYWTTIDGKDTSFYESEAKAKEHNDWVMNNPKLAKQRGLKRWHLENMIGGN